ncbi:dual-specificity RNA methyltransferase RlmN [Clostridium estertheticum]|uniref:Probable dual-specificity RNA methyltransferase RlmN n=2 Tax=Clostridium estertheticum TaxID=238834 RepID=A0A1J0GI31_9CLOT|nr:23S rRNA (adenine(2503)-C(2))-methyltransferase RlmN [Clostridium estertheticum]APC40971.1 23S rRNA (adenine(2503)-C(2))-methyltransferase [Clostridium estertheticum subsp. estertheticum]MBU3074035.1 23S rRNA (adenine(2503)-C(2))-methyltransferase RlmN [Clostridium estertheticum]MBU3164129.1 23S rRNA (adenine(2503)-C(2))-methyltransferase RlmN [Clostridium estertheticum]MBZ9617160.1 23S rRNA (adenine(2503)-C(2))-methyltransferase RlmN [Clostridium estertheticum subsp. laramiense]MPQ32352.1 
MINILDMDLEELKQWMKSNGESKFRAKQVFDWIYKDICEFENMNNIPQSVRGKLQTYFYIGIPRLIEEYTSKNNDTRKYLFELGDGNLIECVVMKYKHGNSICISTQVGCRMGCKFCASTIGGMIRNISPGEMLAQILKAQQLINERISNVVLMGSGEPFDNFDNVMKFLEIVNSENGLNIGQRHITISTCGIVPKIKEFADFNMQITLAISLHAPSDEIRVKSMPIANKYSIAEIIDVSKYYIDKTNRRITFEYALVKGLNDSKQDAEKLSALLKDMLCHVNLIPVNEIKENELERSSNDDVTEFKRVLEANNIQTTIRREMGLDINAACGQLRRSHIKGEELK